MLLGALSEQSVLTDTEYGRGGFAPQKCLPENIYRFLVNLAVADLCVGIFVMLPAIYKVKVLVHRALGDQGQGLVKVKVKVLLRSKSRSMYREQYMLA